MKFKSYLLICIFLIASQLVLSQRDNEEEIWVTATVKDAENNPIRDGFIYVDSVKTRIKTNRKGRFKMWLKPNTKVISVFSWLNGIHSLPYTVEREIEIKFPKNNKAIDESELVDLGYTIKIPKRPNEKVKRKTRDYSKYQNVYQMIVAEVPGAKAQNGVILLRGNARNSINNEAPPLLIVDGTPVGSIDFILPNEIAKLEVLRDESASLYGVRAQGGVIRITLKK